jgi:hypothetical protein
MNLRICAPKERHAGLNRNNSNMVLFVDERGFSPQGKAPTARNSSIQLHIPINQEGNVREDLFPQGEACRWYPEKLDRQYMRQHNAKSPS